MERILNIFGRNKANKIISEMEILGFFKNVNSEEIKVEIKKNYKEYKKVILPEEMGISLKKEKIDIFGSGVKEAFKNLIEFGKKNGIDIKIENYKEEMLDNLKYKKIATINGENFIIYNGKIDSLDKFEIVLQNFSRILLRLGKKAGLKNDFYINNNEEIVFLSEEQKAFLEKINHQEIKI